MAGHQLRNVLFMVVFLLILATLRDNLTSPWQERASILLWGSILAGLGYAGVVIRRLRRNSGAVLLDLPSPWPGIRLLQVLLAVLGVGLGLFILLTLPAELEALLARLLYGIV